MEIKMATLKQLTANRANAKKSTGPRTDAGKVRSRLNSWKHGLTAGELTVGSEDPSKFDALRADLWTQFQPEVGLESILVDRLAGYAWRLRRIPAFEAALLNDQSPHPGRQELSLDLSGANMLTILSRYEAALLNAFNRTLQQLIVLRDRRRSEEEQDRTVEVLPAPDDRDAA